MCFQSFVHSFRLNHFENFNLNCPSRFYRLNREIDLPGQDQGNLSPNTFRKRWRTLNARELLNYPGLWKKAASEAGSSACEDDFEDIISGRKTTCPRHGARCPHSPSRNLSTGQQIFQDGRNEQNMKDPPTFPTRPYHRRKFTFVRFFSFMFSFYDSVQKFRRHPSTTNLKFRLFCSKNRAVPRSRTCSSISLPVHARPFTT